MIDPAQEFSVQGVSFQWGLSGTVGMPICVTRVESMKLALDPESRRAKNSMLCLA